MTNYVKYCLILILLSVFLLNCSDDLTDNKLENTTPETNLFLYPDSAISQQPSQLTLHWWGDDPDGLIHGYYYSWDGSSWQFTTENKKLFALQIGANDTDYVFSVMAVDDYGNKKYDESVVRNNINLGAEPFVDKNENGVYDQGETFIDIGQADPTPATMKFPIKNSKPEIEWSELCVLPDSSFPVMTFGWYASDIDGDETLSKINVALNDTNNYVSIDGSIELITIKCDDYNTADPQTKIYLNANSNQPASETLPGIKFNAENKLYVQAMDISGAKTSFISLPDSGKSWYIKKPKGNLLVFDNYVIADEAENFYREKFDSLQNNQLKGNYDYWDWKTNPSPYQNITFLETIKLFKGVFWYTDNAPDLDLASVALQNYLDFGGKVFFSMLLPRTVNIAELQGFLPIDSTASSFISSVVSGTEIEPFDGTSGFPTLKTTRSVYVVRTLYPSSTSAVSIYNLNSNLAKETKIIGFRNTDNNLYYLGMPLHSSDGYSGNIVKLLDKIFFVEFGIAL